MSIADNILETLYDATFNKRAGLDMTRDAAVAYLAGGGMLPPAGNIVWLSGLAYQVVPGSTAIPDLPGLEVYGVRADEGGSRMVGMRTATAVLDFGSIAAQSAATLTMTLTGVGASDELTVTPLAPINPGLMFRAEYSAADTVAVIAQNVTAGAIDPSSTSFRVVARRFA